MLNILQQEVQGSSQLPDEILCCLILASGEINPETLPRNSIYTPKFKIDTKHDGL